MKLGMISEKCLIINVISLRESYERCEISEVWWIDGKDNLVDVCMKESLNQALEKLVISNSLTVWVEAFINRLD